MTTKRVTNALDSYVSQKAPASNFYFQNVLRVSAGAGTWQLAYLFFTRPFPLGVTITSAKLRLYQYGAHTGTTRVDVQRVSSGWSQNKINWNNDPGVTGTVVSVTKGSTAGGVLWEFDVTAHMQLIANGSPWYGWRVATNVANQLLFHSTQSPTVGARPHLEITWSDAPDKPDQLQPSGGRVVGKTKPMFLFNYNDPSGEDGIQSVQVQIASTAALLAANTPDVWDSGTVTSTAAALDSAGTGMWAAGATAGTVYYWRVRVTDDSGQTSVWSDAESFSYQPKGTLTMNVDGDGTVVATNYIHDPSTNDGTISPWVSYGVNTVVSSVVASDGRRTIKAEKATAAANNVGASTNGLTPRPANTQVTVSAWVQNPVGSTDTIVQIIRRDDTGNVTFATDSIAVPADGVWRRISTTRTDPNVLERVYITKPGANLPVGETLYVRDVMVNDGGLIDFFDADTPDTETNDYSWSGTSYASSSTKRLVGVFSQIPVVYWAFTGQTQRHYQLIVIDADTNVQLWNTGKVTSTQTSVALPVGVVKRDDQRFRFVLRVYDTLSRISGPGDDVYVEKEVTRGVVYDATVNGIESITGASDPVFPTYELTFVESTPPDWFEVQRRLAGETVWTYASEIIDPDDVFVSGTTYKYEDHGAGMYKNYEWRVLTVRGGKQSETTLLTAGRVRRLAPFLMTPDKSKIIGIMNADRNRSNGDRQDLLEPLSGPPVLFTQYIGGDRGNVSGVIADGTVPGYTGKQMFDWFLWMRNNPGIRLFLFVADEALEVAIYHCQFDKLTDVEGVYYAISFDWVSLK